MTDSLRDRIAAVIARMNDCWCEDCRVEPDEFDLMVADAVIRELGMTEFRVEHPVQHRCNKPLGDPGRFCLLDANHEGKCW